jgi:hypothetical protein
MSVRAEAWWCRYIVLGRRAILASSLSPTAFVSRSLRFSLPYMLHELGWSAQIRVNGSNLPEHSVETSVSEQGVPIITCWVPSTAGKVNTFNALSLQIGVNKYSPLR